MRKIIFVTLVSGLLLMASCAKTPPANPGGSWVFKQTTYNTTTCAATGNILLASSASGSLTVNFYSFPTASGYLTVASGGYPNTFSQVGIAATVGNTANALHYTSTGGNGQQQVYVTLTNGKVNVSGTGIEMQNGASPYDSSALTLNITQLQ